MSYESAVESLEERHPLIRRGLITVAGADLSQAVRDNPRLQDASEVKSVAAMLVGALRKLPPPPDLHVLHVTGAGHDRRLMDQPILWTRFPAGRAHLLPRTWNGS